MGLIFKKNFKLLGATSGRESREETVGFQGGHEDVENPEEEQEETGEDLGNTRTSEFTSDLGVTTQQHDCDGGEGFNTEEGHSKGQAGNEYIS